MKGITNILILSFVICIGLSSCTSVPTDSSATSSANPVSIIASSIPENTPTSIITPSTEITKAPTPTVKPTPEITRKPTATPTPEIVIKDVWDKIDRAKLALYNGSVINPFGIDAGGTTAVVLKDASGNDAPFFIVKGGENGFSGPIYNFVQQAISRLNSYDPTLVSTYLKKVDCITGDINGEKITESRGFGASFMNYNFANTIFINGSGNGSLLTAPTESAIKMTIFFLITEKNGLDYYNKPSIGGGRTVGVYKAEEGKVEFKKLYDEGKISQSDWDFYSWNCDHARQYAIDNGY